MAKYIITQQIAVDAETPQEAVAKMSEGKTIGFTVTERPPAPAGGVGQQVGPPRTILTGPTPSA